MILTLVTNIMTKMSIFTCSLLHAITYFKRVDLCRPPTTYPMTLKHYQEEAYDDIYLSGLRPFIASQIQRSLLSSDCLAKITTIFSYAICITTSMPSSPLSLTPSDSTPPLAIAVSTLRAHDDGLPHRSNGVRLSHGRDYNSFMSCPYPWQAK